MKISLRSALLLLAALVATSPLMAETPVAAALVDINTASQAELEAVKGIATVTAEKIIARRPYGSVDDLKKAGVNPATLAQIRPYLTVATITAVPGMVWVNLDTKIFHRAGDPWFGRTKNGKMMPEAEALQAGYHEARPGAVAPKKKD